jgi:glutaryl-CoA dehydrogenase
MAKTDLFEAPDYYLLDELLSEEHKLIRASVRDWVKKEVSPIIEDYAQKAEFPKQLLKGLAEIGAFGPTIPVEYGGAGLDYMAYGIIMQEIERGDSGHPLNGFGTGLVSNVSYICLWQRRTKT